MGDVQIDEVLAKEIESKNPRVLFNPGLFKEENSVEMQIPFIQMALKDVKVVPNERHCILANREEIYAHT